MKKLILAASIAALAAALGACSTPFAGDTTTIQTSVIGANISPSTGVSIGYGSAEAQFTPTYDPKTGTLYSFKGPCGRDGPAPTQSVLNGNATASATGSAQNSTSPQASVAINRGVWEGEAAILNSMATVESAYGGKYPIIEAYNNCGAGPATAAQPAPLAK